MENLPPIKEMYSSILEQRDYDVTRRYQNTKITSELKKSPTKKGSYLDDAIKLHSSPGPANKSNIIQEWAKPNKQLVKYSDRKTYVDEIQCVAKKRNSPSPNQYNVKMKWPEEKSKQSHVSQKTSFLDHSQYQSDKTPGPGNYMIATQIARKVKQYHFNTTKPLQPRKDFAADMNTYSPVPRDYDTFAGIQKYGKIKNNVATNKTQTSPKKQKQNFSSIPGPGQYQMINSWLGKDKKIPKGSISYLSKISKGPSLNIYY